MTGIVHLLAPAAIDDPARPSGGNVYDRRLSVELERLGWVVQVNALDGAWPDPASADLVTLDAMLRGLPADDVVLADGLVASAAPDVIEQHAASRRIVVLVHQPLGVVTPERRASEAAMLASVEAVVTTSEWTRDWLRTEYDARPDRVSVAVPGADPAELATGTPDGRSLLCVGAVTHGKGQDVLLDALAEIADLDWHCTLVGSLDIDPAFAAAVRARVDPGRVDLTGALLGADLDAAYRAADVLVLPSRAETYGMVVTEALARGLPVIATESGGTLEALGLVHQHANVARGADEHPDRPTGDIRMSGCEDPGLTGVVPGLTVPPGDPGALAGALRAWLGDPDLRVSARKAATERRTHLPTWADTAAHVAAALVG